MNSYGNIPTGGITNSRKFSKSVSNNTNVSGAITVTITCDYAAKDTNTPSLNSVYAAGSNYLLTNVEQERIAGDLARITLTYTAAYDSLPATTVVEQTAQMEVDIREHPHFNDWSDEWDSVAGEFKPSSSKYGIKSYIAGCTTVIKTEYFSSIPSSGHDSVGKLASPATGYGSSDNWLVIGCTRQQQNNFWTKQTTYLYSAKAYDSDIYTS